MGAQDIFAQADCSRCNDHPRTFQVPLRSVRRAMPCECQWGISGIVTGAAIVAAAGVFTFFPAVLGWFDYPLYIDLCWFWFLLGVSIFLFGFLFQICGCQPAGRWHNFKKAKARKAEDNDCESP